MERALLEEALSTLGSVLSDRGLRFELVTVGGSSLMLLGLLDRPTKDLDVVALVEDSIYRKPEPLPEELEQAAREVGRALGLADYWLNAGPSSLLDFGLPDGFPGRAQVRHYGGLTLHIAGRFDQICFKVYAATDLGPRSKHFSDLQILQPTHRELVEAARGSTTHDPSPGYRQELIGLLRTFGIQDVDDQL